MFNEERTEPCLLGMWLIGLFKAGGTADKKFIRPGIQAMYSGVFVFAKISLLKYFLQK